MLHGLESSVIFGLINPYDWYLRLVVELGKGAHGICWDFVTWDVLVQRAINHFAQRAIMYYAQLLAQFQSELVFALVGGFVVSLMYQIRR